MTRTRKTIPPIIVTLTNEDNGFDRDLDSWRSSAAKALSTSSSFSSIRIMNVAIHRPFKAMLRMTALGQQPSFYLETLGWLVSAKSGS